MTTPDRRCSGCGYVESDHVAGRCPVCVCGEVVDAHPCIATPAAPLLAFMEKGAKVHRPCPAKETQLRHGQFKAEASAERYQWFGMLPAYTPEQVKARAVATSVTELKSVGPPQVKARPPAGPGEFASYRGQAAKLGRLAIEAGWTVNALYWRDADDVEGCGVWLWRGPLRGVATWARAAGKQGAKSGWSADVAYAWRADASDRFPSKITHTELERLINDTGD